MKNTKEVVESPIMKRMIELKKKREDRLSTLKKCISNYKQLMSLSDQELRQKSINDSYQSEDNWCKSYLGKAAECEIQYVMSFNKENLGAINDPLVDGVVKIEKVNYAVFTFGTTHEKMLLSKILKRTMTADEYYRLLSGRVVIGESKESIKYFIERPEDYESLISNYNEFHASDSKLKFDPKPGGTIEEPVVEVEEENLFEPEKKIQKEYKKSNKIPAWVYWALLTVVSAIGYYLTL